MAECHYGVLLQHYTYAYPTHQVRVQSAVEMQARSRGTTGKITIPFHTNLTVLLSGNKALVYSIHVEFSDCSNKHCINQSMNSAATDAYYGVVSFILRFVTLKCYKVLLELH